MKQSSPRSARHQFTLDLDAGILGRIVGMYAARGIQIEALTYRQLSASVATLLITSSADEERLRVLVAKAAALFGVVDAVDVG